MVPHHGISTQIFPFTNCQKCSGNRNISSLTRGVRQIFAEVMQKICSWFYFIWYPPTNFFQRLPFFSSLFSGPTDFFPEMQIFSTQIWRPTHISVENFHIPIFDPLISRSLSAIVGVFRDIQVFDEFLSCWAIQASKIVTNDPFLEYFF